MAEARFVVRLPVEDRDSVGVEDIRAWLRHRFRGSDLLKVASFPNRPQGEFGITVVFYGGKRLLWRVVAEVQEAVTEVAPGASLETISADFSARLGPVLAGPRSLTGEGAPADRYVNTLIVQAGTEDAVAIDQPLTLATDYTVLLSIADYIEGSLLPGNDALLPDRLLPDRGSWLRAVLAQDDSSHTVVRAFFLPHSGPGFACDCPPDGPHANDCTPRAWVRLPLRTPDEPAIVSAELGIYYETAAVHVQRLTLPAGEGMPGGPRTHLLGRLTRTFSDTGKLAGRSVSIVAANGASRIVVNSADFAGGPFAIPAPQGDTSARDTRHALYDIHFQDSGRGLRSRYAPDYSKPAAQFHADLLRLAEDGAALYNALFGSWNADTRNAKTLRYLLRHEAEIRRRPPVIQVIDGQPSEHTMLWSIVYDIPLSGSGDLADYEMCHSLQWLGADATATSPPLMCPDGVDHLGRGNVLCPFGFWGLSCVIEQPPRVPRDLEALVLPEGEDLSFVIAPDDSLEPHLTARHLQALDVCLPEHSVTVPPIETKQQLMKALAPDAMDVVYFYCHSGYERRSRQGTVGNYLNLGNYQIRPMDVAKWASTNDWPDPHWPRRHPLVILNGCHTTEATSGTLNSFVPAFTQWAAASGVVGTEVMLEQGLAGWAMELMLAALAGGATVGNAIREVRWTMLSRGNVMGFAYTPYCLANLALRRPLREA